MNDGHHLPKTEAPAERLMGEHFYSEILTMRSLSVDSINGVAL